jgi:AAA+ ATPase superfamily predicted ATPase
VIRFVDREKELEFLNSEYRKADASLVVIYGRRRIGKTALIKEFIQGKPAVYYLASEEVERENLISLQELIAGFTANQLLKKGSNFSWEDLLLTFKDQPTKGKKVIAIDEFQYLCKINPAFPSIFQKIWDNHLKNENIMVILCGSLISMMESQVLDYSSPLYGRRTGQIKLKPISFLDYRQFYPTKTDDELVQYYAVTGGVPKYIEAFNETNDIYEAIRQQILNKQSFLYEEPVFLLEKEVNEIGSYFSVIKTIAQGNHKLGKIAASLEVAPSKLTKYIAILINIDLLERQVPVTESNPEKSKKGLYFIKDNFIEFWFKFIFPYRSFLEIDNQDYVINRIRGNFIDNHVSFVFEKICLERLAEMNTKHIFNFPILRFGKWWNNNTEIDLVGLNEESRQIIFGECKYSKTPVDTDILNNLVHKAKQVQWFNNERKESYIIFSRFGFTKDLIELAKQRKDLWLV